MNGLDVLSEDECRRLLSEATLGRVAIATDGPPVVLPVNYIVAGREILFFTAEGTKLAAATANATVAFEIDHFNAVTRTGWSVLVIGPAAECTQPALINGAMAAGLRPWAAGDRSHLIALRADVVTGRRVLPQAAGDHPPLLGPGARVGALAHTPVRVDGGWSIRSVLSAMRAAHATAAVVGNDEAVVTERDLTRAMTAGLGPDVAVAVVCVTDVVSVDQDTRIVDAASVMLDYDVRHLLVCNHRGDVTGMVSLRDLLRVLVDAMDPAIWVVLSQRMSLRGDVAVERPHR